MVGFQLAYLSMTTPETNADDATNSDAGQQREEDPMKGLVNDVLIVRERHKTYRLAIVSGAVLAGMGITAWAIVRIKENNTVWDIIATTLIVILAGWKPVSKIISIEANFRQYMETDHQRACKLEQSVDPDRTSSGLNKDGTSPHGT